MADENETRFAGFDVIGDVHGHAAKLVGLLAELGCESSDGTWRHPTRQALSSSRTERRSVRLNSQASVRFEGVRRLPRRRLRGDLPLRPLLGVRRATQRSRV